MTSWINSGELWRPAALPMAPAVLRALAVQCDPMGSGDPISSGAPTDDRIRFGVPMGCGDPIGFDGPSGAPMGPGASGDPVGVGVPVRCGEPIRCGALVYSGGSMWCGDPRISAGDTMGCGDPLGCERTRGGGQGVKQRVLLGRCTRTSGGQASKTSEAKAHMWIGRVVTRVVVRRSRHRGLAGRTRDRGANTHP